MILIYTTCKDRKGAEKIGRAVLKKRLAACAVVLPDAVSFYWWPPRGAGRALSKGGGPPGKRKIIKSAEAILLLKTVKEKYAAIEREIKRLHSYKIPAILEIPVRKTDRKYLTWLRKEV